MNKQDRHIKLQPTTNNQQPTTVEIFFMNFAVNT
jgi:hypothetical protein